jgi:hypothetical protein
MLIHGKDERHNGTNQMIQMKRIMILMACKMHVIHDDDVWIMWDGEMVCNILTMAVGEE